MPEAKCPLQADIKVVKLWNQKYSFSQKKLKWAQSDGGGLF